MASTLDQLKNQMNNIMNENKVQSNVKNTKSDRDILEIERDLLQSGLNIQFQKRISELDPEMKDQPFGGSGFKREEYALSWAKWKEKGHRLILTNVTHNHSKLLIECPDQFKKESLGLLNNFLQGLAGEIKAMNK